MWREPLMRPRNYPPPARLLDKCIGRLCSGARSVLRGRVSPLQLSPAAQDWVRDLSYPVSPNVSTPESPRTTRRQVLPFFAINARAEFLARSLATPLSPNAPQGAIASAA